MTEDAKKIVDALKHCADIDSECFGCVYENDCSNACPNDYAAKIKSDAADMIEQLSEELERLKEKPLQKPLTLEEACESKEPCVYLEQKDGSLFAAWAKAYEKTMLYLYSKREDVCAISTFAKHELFEKQKYNKTWRCWATKPTDEERKAAKWDD